MMRPRSVLSRVLQFGLAVVLVAGFAVPASAQTGQKLKVALVLAGTVSDKGFNAGGYQGLVRIKNELGFETAFSEGVARGDMVASFRDYAARGFDIVVGHGFPTGDALGRVAAEFPKQFFLNTYGSPTGKNVAVLDCRWEELFHVMGYLTGLMTKNGKVGIVGGWEAPGIRLQVEAFRRGVLAARPGAEPHVIYTGTFYDPVKGKEAARALIGQDVDILAHMADQSGLGVIEAAREAKVMAVGYFEDQRQLAPEQVISSAVIRSGDMIHLMAQDIAAGSFRSGRHLYGLKDDVLQVGPFGSSVPAPVRDKINAMVEDIKAGRTKIPPINMNELMKKKIRKL